MLLCFGVSDVNFDSISQILVAISLVALVKLLAPLYNVSELSRMSTALSDALRVLLDPKHHAIFSSLNPQEQSLDGLVSSLRQLRVRHLNQSAILHIIDGVLSACESAQRESGKLGGHYTPFLALVWCKNTKSNPFTTITPSHIM